MAMSGGIIDKERNPFVRDSWVDQGFGLTRNRGDRQSKLKMLFGMTVQEVWKFKDNDGKYPAFVGIRWGFAEIKEGLLCKTSKWDNRHQYDEYGHIVTAGKTTRKINVQERTTHRRTAGTSNKKNMEFLLASEEELISSLELFKHKADEVKNHYISKDLKNKTIDELMAFSVDSSIYRYFGHETPSSRYRRWRFYGKGYLIVEQLNRTDTQADFDASVFEWAKSLREDWGPLNDDGDPTKMIEGVSLKIVNLVCKHLFYSAHNRNNRAEYFLHVPWDKFTLEPIMLPFNKIVRTIGLPAIRPKQGMGYVANLKIYNELHKFISFIAEEAHVPRIYYEFMAWDKRH